MKRIVYLSILAAVAALVPSVSCHRDDSSDEVFDRAVYNKYVFHY